MNCKQGDLAIVVRSVAGNEGKIVRCVRWIGALPGFVNEDLWKTDVALRSVGELTHDDRGLCQLASDSQLRPLRGDLLDKETESTKELEQVD